MVDYFAIALTHGLIALAAWRLMTRDDLDTDAAQSLAAFQQETPPHYDSGTAGRIGPKTAELLSRARSVIVETATFAVFIRSKGATSEEVHRLAIALAKAIVHAVPVD